MLRSDEIRKPGFTWCAVTKEHARGDHWDRIDFIFAGKAESNMLTDWDWRATKSIVLGESEAEADQVCTPWTSDHRALLTEVQLARKLNGL